ncbi:MAG: hypothetical protein JWP25_2139 [Bradyrhizobium sp.]|nr:hypothetical protein [Bradyrhizobium sp.]
MTTGAILSYLKEHAKRVRYFVSGSDPGPLAADTPIQAYVLGPPKTRSSLSAAILVGGSYLQGETDELAAYLAAAIQLDKTRDAFDPDEEKTFRMAMPFDEHHLLHLSLLQKSGGAAARYFAPEDEWPDRPRLAPRGGAARAEARL